MATLEYRLAGEEDQLIRSWRGQQKNWKFCSQDSDSSYTPLELFQQNNAVASTSEKQYCGSQEDAPKQKAKSLEPSTMLIHRLNLYMLFSHATPFGEKQVSPRNRVAIKGAVKINSSFQFGVTILSHKNVSVPRRELKRC